MLLWSSRGGVIVFYSNNNHLNTLLKNPNFLCFASQNENLFYFFYKNRPENIEIYDKFQIMNIVIATDYDLEVERMKY